MNFEPGELIVKLKDNVDTKVYYAKSGKATSSFNIGQLLGIEDKVASSSVMFHQKGIAASIVNKQKMKAVYAAKAAANPNNGYKPKEPLTMKNVFVLKTSDQQENILQLIQQIKDNPNVEYAEPNYIYGIDDFEVGETITAEEASKMTTSNSSSTIEVNDPLYSSQSNITATNIDDVWDQYTTGDGSQVIAILDTGVDYTHPDLAANTWINEAELNGVAGYDDDGNGYIDDIRGWDFINNDNAPLDDNMHGTHVAGIAGAVGNNGIGIAGAAWNVKLMPIKVFQSSGQGNSTTIAAGVEYASSNGATIINMSFGSYAQSFTLQTALENSYITTILVAAAGNDGICIGPGGNCAPHYPSAYNYVLGIEDRPTFGYTNHDQDGPIATKYSQLLNYELAAPGTGIMSTIPGGGYATLTGTSMGTPLIVGALALYVELKPQDSKELIFGNLINTSENSATSSASFVDFIAAIEVVPEPELKVVNFIARDTINGQNGNDIIQPGETVEILPLVKNYWGPTDDVRVGITFAEFEDTSKATIDQNEIEIGSISAYASLQDINESIKITIAEGVANNVDIKFNLTVWSGPDQEYISEPTEIVINVKNSILLSGLQYEDLTLSPQNEYLIVDNLVLMGESVLTILPGTTLKFSDGKKLINQENSSIYAVGTKDSIINFEAENENWKGFEGTTGTFKFCKISNIGIGTNGVYFFGIGGTAYFEDCLFTDFQITSIYRGNSSAIDFGRVNFVDGIISGAVKNIYSNGLINNFNNINIINILGKVNNDLSLFIVYNSPYAINLEAIPESSNNHGWSDMYIPTEDIYEIGEDQYAPNFTFNTFNVQKFVNGESDSFGNWQWIPSKAKVLRQSYSVSGQVHKYLNFYLGSSSSEIFADYIDDATTMDNTSGVIDLSYIKTTPHEGAHGIVWKLEVNGYDAQDEYALLDPIGVGPHEFKVYFNREMDTSMDPQISYGVTIPYNQKIISEEGTWSSDGKIYTVNHDVNIGVADGINRIRVQGAQDLDYFKIPVEDSRFNMLVQSAGSASAGWFATPGLGEIALTWEAPLAEDIDDALGYNMYRYQVDADGVVSTPVKLNESLIVEDTDESTTGVYYSDFDVTEGQTYFYKYNILRTSFETTDYSSVVSTSPLTSTLGDSNGDFSVNVMDLVHDVDYILGNNPTPFIFLAGDVNADLAINVLDIVGTVDIILNPSTTSNSSVGSNGIQFYPSEAIGNANFTWEGNDLYVASDHTIGGIQLAFNADFEYVLSEDLPTIEHLDYTQEDSKILMLYSFNNTMIASSKTKILTRLDASQEFDIEQAVVGTTTGAKLNATLNNGTLSTIDAPFQNKNLQFLNLFPNPSKGLVNLEYYLPEQMDQVVVKVYDMLGRMVHIQVLENREGISKTPMELSRLKTGNYIVLITANKGGAIKNIANKKLIVK
ncbi:S8 family serine peptidase [Polaribacter sp.]|nr:S8 family serine peptidase [Polaribacter sp.]